MKSDGAPGRLAPLLALSAGAVWSFGTVLARVADESDAFQYLMWRSVGIIVVVEAWALYARRPQSTLRAFTSGRRMIAANIALLLASIGFIYAVIYLGADTDQPTFVQIILVPHHAGPILGAVFYMSVQTKWRYLALLTLAPGMFTGLVGVGRTAFIAPVIFWISGALAYGVYLGGRRLTFMTPRRVATPASSMCCMTRH